MTRAPHSLSTTLAIGLFAIGGHATAQDVDRFKLKLSAFQTDSRIALAADGRARVDEFPLSLAFGGREQIRGSRTRPHVQAMWRMTDRQRLMAAHYETGQGRRYPFSESLTMNEFPDERLDIHGEAGFDIEFELFNLMYEFAILSTDQWTVGVAGGLHWARLEAWADVVATAEYDGETRSESLDYEWVRRRWAPSLGVRAEYRPSDRWRLSVDGQGFSTGWGNFTSEDGNYVRLALNAEYRVTPNFGVHAGYDWFRLKIADDFRGSLVGGDITYRGRARGVLEVKGPTLGVTFAF